MNPVQNSHSDSFIVKYKDEKKEVTVKRTKVKCWETQIRDLETGLVRKGPYVPGNPEDFDFDPKTETWVSKKSKYK